MKPATEELFAEFKPRAENMLRRVESKLVDQVTLECLLSVIK